MRKILSLNLATSNATFAKAILEFILLFLGGGGKPKFPQR